MKKSQPILFGVLKKAFTHVFALLLCTTVLTQAQNLDFTYQNFRNGDRIVWSTLQNGLICYPNGSAYTTDGGNNWSIWTAFNGSPVVAQAPSANHIIAITITQIFTSFNGNTFTSTSNPGGGYFKDICFVDDDHGWAIGSGLGNSLRTTDGGATWIPMSTTLTGTAVAFVSTTVGCAGTANGKLFYSTDGASWTQATTPVALSSDYTITSISFTNAITACATAASVTNKTGLILRTIDAGLNWTIVHSDVAENVWQVDFRTVSEGYAVGELFSPRNPNGLNAALILKTTDLGQTWTQQTIQGVTICHPQGVNFFNSSFGWMVGGGCLYKYNNVTGFEEVEESIAPTVSPNPAANTLYINFGNGFDEPVNFNITDATGKVVLHYTTVTGEIDIDIAHLSTGIYFVTGGNGTHNFAHRFIKE